MPGLTKKKTRTKVLRKAGTGRADKDIGNVARFARDHKTTLKALGWVFATPVMLGKEAGKRLKGRGANKTVTGQSKGMRGSETKRKRSPHR